MSRDARRKGNDMAGTNGRAKRHFFGGTGLYIALFLGVTALAVAGYWTLLPGSTTDRDAEASAKVELPAQEEESVEMPEADFDDASLLPPEQSAAREIDEPALAPDALPAAESSADIAPEEPRLVVAPLVGETLAVFSVDELRYNETLGDWRTHSGVDIAAEVGTQVLAACSGTVTQVVDDDLMGTSVTIAHDGGYETIYANLLAAPAVSEGQQVSAGEVIGSVGCTSIAEFAIPAHLHFAVTKDGVPCDPETFLN